MKYILLSILLGTLFIGCKKESVDQAIVGTWELRHFVGGYQLAGNNNPDYSPGNGNILKFSDSSYYYYSNGQLRGNGSYLLVKDTCAATGQYMDGMIFDHHSYLDLSFEIKNNILTLYRGIVAGDGTIETYERIEHYR